MPFGHYFTLDRGPETNLSTSHFELPVCSLCEGELESVYVTAPAL